MNKFIEWLSDYLRYIILAVIIVLVIAAAILGLNIYSKTVNNQGGKESEAVKETETQSESKLTVIREPESETQSEPRTEKSTESESETAKETGEQSQESTESGNNSVQAAAQPETKAIPEPTPETEPPTEAPETEPPAPVYKTMTGTCYLRAEPSREAAILGEYWAGTTVEFLGEVSGWYKVQVDGMVGYMGPRFFG